MRQLQRRLGHAPPSPPAAAQKTAATAPLVPPPPTKAPVMAYQHSWDDTPRPELDGDAGSLQAATPLSDKVRALAEGELVALSAAHTAAKERERLLEAVYSADVTASTHTSAAADALAHAEMAVDAVRAAVRSLEQPRDRSLDNGIVLWCSRHFMSACC